MPQFSKKSLDHLATCHPDLQRLFLEVVKHYDCSVICGHRNQKDQDDAVKNGFSKTAWPNSKHNSMPSMAVDVVPFPLPEWTKAKFFCHFAGFVQGMANRMGIAIRWGGDFNGDLNLENDKFIDAPHFELKEKPNADSK